MKKTGCCFAIIFIAWGCGNPSVTDEKFIFRYNEPSGITSLDPAYAANLPNIWALLQLYNTLVQLDDSLQVQPCLANAWNISEDRLTYTFFLRNDVFFHEDICFGAEKSRKLLAEDVVFSLKRIRNTGSGGWIMTSVDSIFAENDTILHILLKQPFPGFISLLANPYCAVVAPEAIQKYGKDFRNHPVGTGPFYLMSWWEGEKMILRKNPVYFEKEGGQQLPYADGIAITFLKEKQTAFLDLVTGKLDFISGLDPAYKTQALDRSGKLRENLATSIALKKQVYLNTEYIGFRMGTGGLFDNKWLRIALAYYINREKLVRYVRFGIGQPGLYGMVPPPLMGNLQTPGFHYDPGKGKANLVKAGYQQPSDLPPFNIYFDVAYTDIATALVNQLREAGFKAEAVILDRPTLKSQVAKGALEIFRGSWIADYPDAENYLSLFYSPNKAPAGPNYTHFSSETFDRLYEEAREEANDSIRNRLYAEMDRLVIEESPVIVLYYDEVVRFVKKDLQGIAPNPLNYLYLKKVRKPD